MAKGTTLYFISNNRNRTLQTVWRNSYIYPLEVYHAFAYYLCFVPFRLKKSNSGRFIAQSWYIQKIFCCIVYLVQLVYCCAQIYKFIAIMSAEITARTVSGYLELFEYMTNVAAFSTLTYSHFFKSNEMLNFINKMQIFLKSQPPEKPSNQNPVFILWRPFCILGMAFYTMMAILTPFLYTDFKFSFNETLESVRDELLIGDGLQILGDNEVNVKNVLFAGLYFTIDTILNVKDTYLDLYFICGATCFYMTGSDFLRNCISVDLKRLNSSSEIKCKARDLESFKVYRKISKLTRIYSEPTDGALLFYILHCITYCSIVAVDWITVAGKVGYTIYTAQMFSLIVAVFWFSSSFASYMSKIGILIDYRFVPKQLDQNATALIWHWAKNDRCSICAKILSMTFSTLSKFVNRAMVFFLISITPNCVKKAKSFGESAIKDDW